MREQNILRTLLFVVFFSIGAAAMSGSILYDDLLVYYTNRELLRSAEESLTRLESLNTDYEVLLRQLQEDPNLIKRIAPATLGVEPEDTNTVYPRVTPEQLDAARRALTDDSDRQLPGELVPGWLRERGNPRQRTILFFAGAFLILISFVWFGSGAQPEKDTP
ncbi:MAG: hypothetical protein ACYS8I_15515 [Planctomycetota bacterium]|jgi:hypothetical protein